MRNVFLMTLQPKYFRLPKQYLAIHVFVFEIYLYFVKLLCYRPTRLPMRKIPNEEIEELLIKH